ncbi:hypothetical protein GCM10009611_21050 [Arthrobacter roseus]
MTQAPLGAGQRLAWPIARSGSGAVGHTAHLTVESSSIIAATGRVASGTIVLVPTTKASRGMSGFVCFDTVLGYNYTRLDPPPFTMLNVVPQDGSQ